MLVDNLMDLVDEIDDHGLGKISILNMAIGWLVMIAISLFS